MNEVNNGQPAYEYLITWLKSNSHHFYNGQEYVCDEIYGTIENNTAYIIRSIFTRVLTDGGYCPSSTIRYLRSNHLIETRGRAYTKCKRVGGVRTECVVLTLATGEDSTEFDGQPL